MVSNANLFFVFYIFYYIIEIYFTQIFTNGNTIQHIYFWLSDSSLTVFFIQMPS